MVGLLKAWQGRVEVNGTEYDSIQDAESVFKTIKGNVHIILKGEVEKPLKSENTRSDNPVKSSSDTVEYRVTVKRYMTQKATPEFDFMAQWNNDEPMPLRTMVGTVEKETRGMVYMKLHGVGLETVTCVCCGKELTNPISRYYGIGPVCMNKVGIYCDVDNIEEIKEKLVDVKWEGWIIKSAITEQEEV